jgi:hypothetical protein
MRLLRWIWNVCVRKDVPSGVLLGGCGEADL